MIEAILLVSVIFCLVYSVMKRPKNFPPGPVVFPVAGIYPLISQDHPLETWTSYWKKYGAYCGFVMGNNVGVLVNGWDAVKEVLTNEDCQGRPDVCLIRDRFDGDNYGVVFTEGDYWKVQRRFTLHHFRNLGFGRKDHESIIEDEAMELVQEVATLNGEPGILLNRVAVSVINTTWSLMGGCRYSHSDPVMKKLAAHIEESLHDIQVTGSVAVAIPFIRHLFPKLTGYTSVVNGSRGVQEFAKTVIKDHKETFDPDKPRDFIDIYLNELINNNKVDPSFTEIQLEALCMDLLSAGTDTTSNTVTFCCLFLAIYPEIQEKVHQEMDEVLGKGRAPSISDRSRLVYTDAVLQEILRFRGPLPIMIPHKTMKPTKVAEFDLPVDCHLLVNVYSVHMEKDYWGDPEIFRPERFITEDRKIKKEERLIPFGKGKRQCLGETIARVMSFMFLASLAQSYKFSLPEGEPIPDTRGDYGFTLAPPNVKLVCTPRV